MRQLLPSVAGNCSHRQVIQQTWWQKFLLSGNVLVRGFLRLAALGVPCVSSQQQLRGAWVARWLTRHSHKHAKHCFSGAVLGQPSLLQTSAAELLLHKTLSLPSQDDRGGSMSSCPAWARPRVTSLVNQGTFSLKKVFNPTCAEAQVSTQWTWKKSESPLPTSHAGPGPPPPPHTHTHT